MGDNKEMNAQVEFLTTQMTQMMEQTRRMQEGMAQLLAENNQLKEHSYQIRTKFVDPVKIRPSRVFSEHSEIDAKTPHQLILKRYTQVSKMKENENRRTFRVYKDLDTGKQYCRYERDPKNFYTWPERKLINPEDVYNTEEESEEGDDAEESEGESEERDDTEQEDGTASTEDTPNRRSPYMMRQRTAI